MKKIAVIQFIPISANVYQGGQTEPFDVPDRAERILNTSIYTGHDGTDYVRIIWLVTS